jgi:hypothetical protein
MNGYRVRFAALATAAILAAFHTAAADALVVRHDVADAAYLARESEFPAVFSLYRSRTGHRDCVATLIAPGHALTAAHCTDVRQLREAIASGHGYGVDVAGRSAVVVAILLPPAQADGSKPDIAILQFRSPVLHVAPMVTHGSADEVGRVVLMPGWGGTGTGKSGAGPSDGLFRAAENRIDRAADGRLYWVFDDPASGRALTLEGISGPGDSGGPALVRTASGWEIAGISSAQRNGGGPEGVYGVEEVFVRMSDFAKWVDAVVRPAKP